ncbi:putative transcriptional regulator [Paenibacillus phyllosphaerae]|uniref:Putative transcriptional regulator n=1 Tax=Paenibacillus phyllosphaerae TaxID=274593 RepID=A0A7W5B4R8_9BACL|nr:ArsR family transcriptional regulator [Paenibacillus phyllosphaerae]MBB3114394.1 putative transcriptional regulator [Paenibacillus phyllosphaerae]
MKIEVSTANMKFLECISSPTRVRIIELLRGESQNITSLSQILGIQPPIVTRHIQMLEEAGIVRSELVPGKRGMQKRCTLLLEEATLSFKSEQSGPIPGCHRTRVPLGQYSNFAVSPPCGLVSVDKRIGMCDDPRYFDDPERMNARMLWFARGFVEYRIPNYLVRGERPTMLEVTMEICSEAPCSHAEQPSDITFMVNGMALGTWTCPGDYAHPRGKYTPHWWTKTQYGLLKTIRVDKTGTYIDGVRASSITLADLAIRPGSELLLRITSLDDARHSGGVSLFGSGFGNYDQDIEAALWYENE